MSDRETGMTERPPGATSATEWARIARRRRVLVWSGAGLAVVAVVAAVLFLLLTGGNDGGDPATFDPVDRGAESSATTSGTDATSGAEPTSHPGASSGTTGSANPTATPGAQGTCRIAYRRAGVLYVADPDGSDEVRAAASVEGAFSIAPDGRTLALVDATTGTLALYDLATGARVAVGPANQEMPVWPVSSAWVVYSTGSGSGARVLRVDRDGRNAKTLFTGGEAAVSPDGAVVCGIAHAPSGASSVVVYHGGRAASLPVAGYATDVACSSTRVFYSLAGDDGADSSIRSMSLDGGDVLTIRTGPQAGSRVSFQDLCLKPDGTRVAFTEAGDDGYSRLFVMGVDGGGSRTLSVRRDDYPMCWGCDGRLYFIEGNAIQGEATKLMGVGADGTGRVVIVEGASR